MIWSKHGTKDNSHPALLLPIRRIIGTLFLQVKFKHCLEGDHWLLLFTVLFELSPIWMQSHWLPSQWAPWNVMSWIFISLFGFVLFTNLRWDIAVWIWGWRHFSYPATSFKSAFGLHGVPCAIALRIFN